MDEKDIKRLGEILDDPNVSGETKEVVRKMLDDILKRQGKLVEEIERILKGH